MNLHYSVGYFNFYLDYYRRSLCVLIYANSTPSSIFEFYNSNYEEKFGVIWFDYIKNTIILKNVINVNL
jgi:hypothetical protein